MSKFAYDDVQARKLLRELGIAPHYKGYQFILLSLEYISKDESSLTALNKEIYIPVSEKLCSSSATVEVGIRRSSERAWKCNAGLLKRISPQQLTRRPAVRQFLEILYFACCKVDE